MIFSARRRMLLLLPSLSFRFRERGLERQPTDF